MKYYDNAQRSIKFLKMFSKNSRTLAKSKAKMWKVALRDQQEVIEITKLTKQFLVDLWDYEY